MAYFAVNSVAEMAQSEVTASLPGDTDKQTEGPLDERGNSTAMQTDDQGACDLPSAPCDTGLQRKMATKPSHGNRQRPRWAAEGHVGGRHIAHRWRPERRSTLFRGLRPRIHRRTVLRMSWGLRNFRKRCLGRSRCIRRDPQTYSCMFGARSKHICLHTHPSQPYPSYTLLYPAPQRPGRSEPVVRSLKITGRSSKQHLVQPMHSIHTCNMQMDPQCSYI